MKIRYGSYTVYKGYEMDLSESRDNYPGEEELFIVSYDADSNPKLKGFRKYKYDDGDGNVENEYYKGIYLKDLDNAFVIQTKALYKGYVFDVDSNLLKGELLCLLTKNEEIGKKLNFSELSNHYEKSSYIEDIKLKNIEKLWEERTPSTYDLPMPKGLEKIKVIFDRTKK